MKLFRKFTNTIDFGLKTVPKEKKQELVNDVFTSVAQKYDIMNDFMSLGVHRLWKDEFISDMGYLNSFTPLNFLDVAGGTGDIAFRIREKVKRDTPVYLKSNFNITVSDINPGMLSVGKQRAKALGYDFSWVEANAEELPFEDSSFDFYTIAFGIRNVTDRLKAVKEAKRVLKKGGRFMCLEFSKVNNPVLDSLYAVFSKYYIPTLGTLIAGDREAYEYLIESIQKFPTQDEFAKLISEAGLSYVNHRDLTFGIAAIHSGVKI
jgi:2-methoxy-6-polyprenyl-1,4-benzoquinol methylase